MKLIRSFLPKFAIVAVAVIAICIVNFSPLSSTTPAHAACELNIPRQWRWEAEPEWQSGQWVEGGCWYVLNKSEYVGGRWSWGFWNNAPIYNQPDVRVYPPPNNNYNQQQGCDTLNQTPTFASPSGGQILSYNGSWAFNVWPVGGADGYLWGIWQNGILVWENVRDGGGVNSNAYTFPNYIRNRLRPGQVTVTVRGRICGSYTNGMGSITVTLR